MTAWRRWRFSRWIAGHAYSAGIIAGYGVEGTPDGWRLFGIRWRGSRPYALWFDTTNWLPWHLVRYRHVPNNVGLGICGKCAAWPCCGSTEYDHAEGCEEA